MLILISLLIINYVMAIHFLYTEKDYDKQTVWFVLIPFLFIIAILYVILERVYDIIRTIRNKIK